MQKTQKVVIALSGGVDSAIAAYLLKQQGYQVFALFMRNWDSFANNDILGNHKLGQTKSLCSQEQDWKDAQAIAKKLKIPLERIDFIDQYWNKVFQPTIKQYQQGLTPNPDIFCNKYIKFDLFLEYALKKFQANYLATGHYAIFKNKQLLQAKDKNKDQTYFLAQVSKQKLNKVLFPIGLLTKPEVRQIAKQQQLVVANKKDSMGICFIGKRKFNQFLQNYIRPQKGKIIDIVTKKVVGQHNGATYYTLGQRKGLNLGGMEQKYFVCGHNMKENIIWVTPESNLKFLLSDKLIATNFNLITQEYSKTNLFAKFRYRQKQVPVKIKFLTKTKISLTFQPFLAITPGQHVVVYDGEKCVGGAIIKKLYFQNQALTYL